MINLGLFIIVVSLFILIMTFIMVPLNKNNLKSELVSGKYCILIPARNESKVIERLLISITKQTYKIEPSDVYVIVESLEDPTVDIVNKYNMNICLRKDLTKKRKGYALDEAIKDILKSKKKYAAYFICDADNVLDKNFIKELANDIFKGYDIGIGYRNNLNSSNLVSCCSSLVFSILNTLGNERKNKYFNNLCVSGTGFYIKGSIIEELEGFPFNTLTEDYELTLYSILNDYTTTYNKEAIFYDEQPELFSLSITQRTRWVKGYIDSRKKYIRSIRKSLKNSSKNNISKINEVIGINPILGLILGIILFLVGVSIDYSIKSSLEILILFLIVVYLFLVVFTYIILLKEKDRLNIGVSFWKILLFNPIFLSSFVVCYIKALFTKNLEWKVIPHGKIFNIDK